MTTNGIGLAKLAGPLAEVADPDGAALGLVRLYEQLTPSDRAALGQVLADDGEPRRRVVGLIGASVALTDALVRRPEQWRDVAEASIDDESTLRAAISDEVGTSVGDEARDLLRVAYRRQLMRIAAVDVSGDSIEQLPVVAQALAELAGLMTDLGVAIDVATASVGLTIAPSATPVANETPGMTSVMNHPTISAEMITNTTDRVLIAVKSRRKSIVGMPMAAE